MGCGRAIRKNNGYGLGVVNVARLLEPLQDVDGLAVIKLHEAMALRDAGIRLPILLMGPADDRELEEAVRRDIMPMIYTPAGPLLDGIAARQQKRVKLHVCVDTGIGRVGVPCAQAPPLLRDLAARRSVDLQGVMMTFTERCTSTRCCRGGWSEATGWTVVGEARAKRYPRSRSIQSGVETNQTTVAASIHALTCGSSRPPLMNSTAGRIVPTSARPDTIWAASLMA